MKKFILIVPSNDDEKFFVDKTFINTLKEYDVPYLISDYNIKNIDYNHICGMVLVGGGDIEPSLYGQEKENKTKDICLERDIFEIELLKQAFERKISVLSVCKGVQTMNVAFGGDVSQHIDDHLQEEDKEVPTHYVDINKESFLYKILKKDKIKVNSFHHQAVNNVANIFTASAKYKDVIEAIEYVDDEMFFMGTQWHPEILRDENSKIIFDYFIKYTQQ